MDVFRLSIAGRSQSSDVARIAAQAAYREPVLDPGFFGISPHTLSDYKPLVFKRALARTETTLDSGNFAEAARAIKAASNRHVLSYNKYRERYLGKLLQCASRLSKDAVFLGVADSVARRIVIHAPHGEGLETRAIRVKKRLHKRLDHQQAVMRRRQVKL